MGEVVDIGRVTDPDRSVVVKDVLAVLAASPGQLLTPRRIWLRINRWSLTSVRHSLRALAKDGAIEAHGEGLMRVYRARPPAAPLPAA